VEAGLHETERARSSLTAIAALPNRLSNDLYDATAASEETIASREIAESAGQISQLSTNNFQASNEAAEACKASPL